MSDFNKEIEEYIKNLPEVMSESEETSPFGESYDKDPRDIWTRIDAGEEVSNYDRRITDDLSFIPYDPSAPGCEGCKHRTDEAWECVIYTTKPSDVFYPGGKCEDFE